MMELNSSSVMPETAVEQTFVPPTLTVVAELFLAMAAMEFAVALSLAILFVAVFLLATSFAAVAVTAIAAGLSFVATFAVALSLAVMEFVMVLIVLLLFAITILVIHWKSSCSSTFIIFTLK